MKTVIEMMRGGIEEDGIRRAGEILKKGGLVAFPTVRKADLQTIR